MRILGSHDVLHGLSLFLRRVREEQDNFKKIKKNRSNFHTKRIGGPPHQLPEQGTVVELPRVGGFHYEYVRMAA